MTAAPDLPPRASVNGWDKAFRDIRSETRRWATRIARGQAPLTASEAARLRALLTTLQGIADLNVAQMTAWGIDRAALSIRQDILLLQKAIPEWAVQTAQGTTNLLGWKNVPNMPAIAQIAQGRVMQMTADFTRLLPEIQDRLTATLTQAVATGEGPARMAQRLQAALDDVGQFGQGRAVMISRTSLASAYDGANQALYQQAASEGIVYGWRWLAEPGACPVCAALDGTVFPVTQNTNRHPNCRCDMLPVFPGDPDAVPYGQRYDPEPGTQADFDRLELVTNPNGYTNWRLAPDKTTAQVADTATNAIEKELDALYEEYLKVIDKMQPIRPLLGTRGFQGEQALRDWQPLLRQQTDLKKQMDEVAARLPKQDAPDTAFVRQTTGTIDEQNAAQRRWIDSRFDTRLSEAGEKARDKYVVDDKGTLKMNANLRAGGKPTAKVREIDKMVREGTVLQDTTVFRGSVLPREMADSFQPGMRFTDAGFQSTDITKSTAQHYANNRLEASARGDLVLFEMNVPAGMNGVYVGYGEFVLPRGCTMTVESVRREGIWKVVRVNVVQP